MPRRPPCRRVLKPGPLPDDAAFAVVYEVEEAAHLGRLGRLLFELALRLGERQAAAVKRAVGALEGVHGRGAEAAPLESVGVEAERLALLSRRRDVRRQILRQVRADAGEAVRADAHMLVHAGEAA